MVDVAASLLFGKLVLKSYQFASAAALFAIWMLLSYGEVFKFAGPHWGLLLCLSFPLVAVAALLRSWAARLQMSPRSVVLCLAGCWLLASVAYLALHPLSARHVFGPGSDREDALSVACRALLAGEFPYRHVTFLGDPITPMPGALLLATPFSLLGRVGAQNLLWIAAFFCWCYYLFDREWTGVWFAVVFVLLCPVVMQDFLTGGDFFTNFVYVIVLFSAVLRALSRPTSHLSLWTWPVLFGIAIASRPIYALVYPCLFAFALQTRGIRTAVRTTALALAGTLGVTLPIFLEDPVHFTPLNAGAMAYSLFPASWHAPFLVFGLGIAVASGALFVRLSIPSTFAILGAAFTAVSLPFYLIDQLLQPASFPSSGLIYLSPGLLLLSMWFLHRGGLRLQAASSARLAGKDVA